ncbi:MAG: DUF1573 domain-containing protein [Thermoflexales bacterium]|nr:DUF1573 domain-containing protein [Thermoflexales bacterium]
MSKKRRGSGYRRSGNRPWIWIAIGVIGVLGLGLLNLWQTGAFASPPPPSRSGDPATLLPLAQGPSLRGGHDPALIPENPPAPRPAPAGQPVPRLDMPEREHAFGRIYARWTVSHVFAVQNTGTADLVITNLVTSCGCTTAELSSSVIPPGHRADLTVTFDADFHPVKGPVTRLVWFATNDPAQPWVEVRITADVRR